MRNQAREQWVENALRASPLFYLARQRAAGGRLPHSALPAHEDPAQAVGVEDVEEGGVGGGVVTHFFELRRLMEEREEEGAWPRGSMRACDAG